MIKERVLFICSRNAARSQIAEGYLRARFGDRYEAYSAGIKPSMVSRYAIQVMREIGIDISRQQSKSLEEFHGKEMDLVVVMCDQENGVCPLFPWAKETIHRVFPELADLNSSEKERLATFRSNRDKIIQWIETSFGDYS